MDHFKVAIVTNIRMRLKFKVARTLQFAVQQIFVILPFLLHMRNFLTGANEFNSCLAVDPRCRITITELLTTKRGVRNAS